MAIDAVDEVNLMIEAAGYEDPYVADIEILYRDDDYYLARWEIDERDLQRDYGDVKEMPSA